MNKDQLTNEISNFHNAVSDFKQLLLDSRDRMMPEIVRNHEKITADRRVLVRKYASLEKYLDKLGKRPKMRDGVNPEYYPVYHNAFSTDILLRVGPSLEAVEQDLDYVLGKLEGMSEEEVTNSIKDSPVDPKIIASAGIPPEQVKIQHVKNPHKQYWWMLSSKVGTWILDHIVAEIIVAVIVAVILIWLGFKQ